MKRFLVEEIYQIHGTASASMPEDTPLEEIIARFASEPGLRSIFLIDSQQRFTAMITPVDLLQWASLRFHGKVVGTQISVGKVSRLVFATQAKDLAHGSRQTLGVKPSDNLQTALEAMIMNEEVVIPVLDKVGKVLGDLRLSEVLMKAIEGAKDSIKS